MAHWQSTVAERTSRWAAGTFEPLRNFVERRRKPQSVERSRRIAAWKRCIQLATGRKRKHISELGPPSRSELVPLSRSELGRQSRRPQRGLERRSPSAGPGRTSRQLAMDRNFGCK